MKRYIITSGLFSVVIAAVIILGSCRKKADTIAQIKVLDSMNLVVPGAKVVLYGKSTTDPIQSVVRQDTATTNSDGIATFLYNDVYQLGQAGFAVLDIRATKNGLKGKGIIKIEEEEENSATVFIQ